MAVWVISVEYVMGIMDSEQGGIDSKEVLLCGGGWQIIHVVLRDAGVT